jgi:effector-binding domain-containing protein
VKDLPKIKPQKNLMMEHEEITDEEFEELSEHASDKIESGFSEPELEATQSKLTDFVQKNDES